MRVRSVYDALLLDAALDHPLMLLAQRLDNSTRYTNTHARSPATHATYIIVMQSTADRICFSITHSVVVGCSGIQERLALVRAMFSRTGQALPAAPRVQYMGVAYE